MEGDCTGQRQITSAGQPKLKTAVSGCEGEEAEHKRERAEAAGKGTVPGRLNSA